MEVQGRVEELRRRVRAGRRRGRLLALGAATTLLVGGLCWAAYYVSTVYAYAELDEAIRMERDSVDPERLILVYRPVSGGTVGFGRTDSDRETELLDRVLPGAVGAEQTFQWRVAGLNAGDVISVTCRDGPFLTTRQLEVPEPAGSAAVGGASLFGQVVNATNKEPVAGAEVRVLGTRLAAQTDEEGRFRLDGVPGGATPIQVSAAGFSTEQRTTDLTAGAEHRLRVVLSPGLEEGQLRVVLTWDAEPPDLDAHLEGPLPDGERFHVYFHEKGDLKSRQFVRLDVDDRDGEGPETITVLGVLPGKYSYYVHDYTHRDDPASTSLGRSGAEVKIYQGGQTYRFRAEAKSPGNVWRVCTIEVTGDGRAVVTPVDEYEGTKVESLGLYAKRTMAHREEWIGEYGGTEASEAAVAEGLQWLARHQAPDGSWGPYCLGREGPRARCEQGSTCPGGGGHYPMAHTGLAVLAFQAGGHYFFNGNTYSGRVRKGLDWMIQNQRDDGGLVSSGNKPYADMGGYRSPFHQYYMYEHGIAAFALLEACAIAVAEGHSDRGRYIGAGEKAVRFIEQMQHADGGWRYTPRKEKTSDTSVAGWQVLALKSAREAGIPVSYECLEKIRDFFELRKMGQNGRTGYTDRFPRTEATTGVGMLARQFLLGEPDAPLVHQAAAFLADYAQRQWPGPVAGGARGGNSSSDFYLWYNGTLAMFQAGGQRWEQWNRVVRDRIVALQRHDGCTRGSWDPNSQWGSRGGRIYTTALAVLTLEVYYRYASHREASEAFQIEVTPRPAAH